MGDAVGEDGGSEFVALMEEALDEYAALHGSFGTTVDQETDAYVNCWRKPPSSFVSGARVCVLVCVCARAPRAGHGSTQHANVRLYVC